MFSLGVSDHVMIAHSFADAFFGPAQRMHGATYSVELELRTSQLGPHQVVMDIGAMRDILRSVLAELDYRNLDDHQAFEGLLSTTERVAEHVANQVATALLSLAADAAPVPGGQLRVLVRESPVAYAAYERPL
jgi:6-pyruvoyltetrahydropterin/6-carboxytetrahydropterin synthase